MWATPAEMLDPVLPPPICVHQGTLSRELRSQRIPFMIHAGSNSREFLSLTMEGSSQLTFRVEAKDKARNDPLTPCQLVASEVKEDGFPCSQEFPL